MPPNTQNNDPNSPVPSIPQPQPAVPQPVTLYPTAQGPAPAVAPVAAPTQEPAQELDNVAEPAPEESEESSDQDEEETDDSDESAEYDDSDEASEDEDQDQETTEDGDDTDDTTDDTEEAAEPEPPKPPKIKDPNRYEWFKNKYLMASNLLLVVIIGVSYPVWLTFSTKLTNLADSVGISFSSELASKQHFVMGAAGALIVINLLICFLRFKWLAIVSILLNGFTAFVIYNQRPDGAPGVKASPLYWAALALVVLHVLVLVAVLVRLKKTKMPAVFETPVPSVPLA